MAITVGVGKGGPPSQGMRIIEQAPKDIEQSTANAQNAGLA